MSKQEIDGNYVKNLILDAAPERKEELRMFWDQYSPKVFIAEDNHRILVQATSTRIEFSSRAMESFWLLGFAAWRAFECYCPAVVLSPVVNTSVSGLIGGDEGFDDAETAFESLIHAARTLIHIGSQDDFEWPDDVPRPYNNRNASDITEKAISDLICIATAYVFLHEMRHVQLGQDDQRPAELFEEEMLCDVFARDFLMGKLASFTTASPWSHEQLAMKRGMGLVVGAFILYELTDRSQLAGSDDYPSIADRFEALIGSMPITDPNHSFWIFTATLLAALVRRRNRRAILDGADAKKICEHLIQQIHQHC